MSAGSIEYWLEDSLNTPEVLGSIPSDAFYFFTFFDSFIFIYFFLYQAGGLYVSFVAGQLSSRLIILYETPYDQARSGVNFNLVAFGDDCIYGFGVSSLIY